MILERKFCNHLIYSNEARYRIYRLFCLNFVDTIYFYFYCGKKRKIRKFFQFARVADEKLFLTTLVYSYKK